MNYIFGNKEQNNDAPDIESGGDTTKSEGFGSSIMNRIRSKTDEISDTTQNYQVGLFIMFTGAVLLGLSMLFLPLVLLSPYKFIALNALGTSTILFSIITMKKKTVISFLLGRDTVLFTLMYAISFVFEIYFSTINKSYIFVFIAFIANLVSILYIVFSFFRKSSFIVGRMASSGVGMMTNTIGKVMGG